MINPPTGSQSIVNAQSDGNTRAAGDDRTFTNIVGWLILWKSVYGLLIVFSIFLLPDIFFRDQFYVVYHFTRDPYTTLARFFETWDAQEYLGISQIGYSPGSRVDAFYPLWPICIRLFSAVTGGNHLLSAMVLANVFSVIGMAVLFRYLQWGFGRATAERALVLFLALPGALFFSMPYSESLFLLLAAMSLLLMKNEKFAASGLGLMLSAMTRPTGTFWAPFLLLEFARNRRKAELAMCLFPVLGYALYLVTMYATTGNPFEQVAVAPLFASHNSLSSLIDVRAFVEAFLNMQPGHSIVDSPIDRLFFLWCLVTLPAVYKLDKTLFAYSLCMGLLPAVMTHFASYMRYSLMDFPVVLVTAIALTRGRWAPAFPVLAAGLFWLQAIMLIRHINYYWAG